MKIPHVIIIGSGPSGLMAAQKLAERGYVVHIYEQNKAAARKFLVAGHGGFNLTHSQNIDDFVLNYDKGLIQEIVRYFNNTETIKWLSDLGIETYVGSSGKIFPKKETKPIEVLNAWLLKLKTLGVTIHYEYQFINFNNREVNLLHKGKTINLSYSKLIFAIGGASWSKTGSTGLWQSVFINNGIKITPFSSANSGYNTKKCFTELQGQILKNIVVHFNDIKKNGEIVFTNYGIEGSPIYYLNRFTRNLSFPLTIYVDLKPNKTKEELILTLENSNNKSKVLKEKIKLSKASLLLLKNLDKESYNNTLTLASLIKQYPITLESYRPIDEVISTAGGINLEELNKNLALKKYPSVYCIGEMLDWEAPTGGYLLQACFSMGYYCANNIIKQS